MNGVLRMKLADLQQKDAPLPDGIGKCRFVPSCKHGLNWWTVDAAHKEDHLFDDEFDKAFGMSREAFKELKPWRQQKLKQSAGLF